MANWILKCAVTVALIGSVYGCSENHEGAQLEKLNYLIDWDPEPTYLGIYYAKELGLFEEIGFDVEIVPLRGANQVIPAIANGANPIGTASGGATVIGASNGNRTLSLAVIYDNIPTVVYGASGQNITSPEDLRGKRIGIYPTSITKDEFDVFLEANGLSRNDVDIVDAVGSDLEMLFQNQIDGALNYTEMSPSRMETEDRWEGPEGGRSFQISLAENGVPGYGLNIITSPGEYERRPEIMQQLSAASVNGYVRGCERPTEATQHFLETIYKTETRIAANRSYVEQSWSRVCNMLASEPGRQNTEGWQQTIDTYAATGRLGSPVSPDQLFVTGDDEN